MSKGKAGKHKREANLDENKKTRPAKEKEYFVSPSMEDAVGITIEELSYLLQLEEVKGLGPQKMKSSFVAGLRPKDVLGNPAKLQIKGKRGEEIQNAIEQAAGQDRKRLIAKAKRYIALAHQHRAEILTYWHPSYPQNVFRSSYPVPFLFARGCMKVLANKAAVACVGSRKIRPPYSEQHKEFAKLASQMRFTVVAGFALGADTIGHRAAIDAGGSTICVMAGGLDRPFPPENKDIWEEFLNCPRAVFVSEAPFGARASGLTLRKRNKLIVALSLGVLVSQSTAKGGAMNAYRFSLEQHKPVATFSDDKTDDTSGNKEMVLQAKSPVAVFNPKESNNESWQRWLQQLLFST